MKVILTQRVSSLGGVGEVVNVSSGYARNYLLPQLKAVVADEANQAELENHKKALAGKVSADKTAAIDLQKKINGMSVKFIKKVAGNGKIFGSVSSMEISRELANLGHDVEKRMIILTKPIKALGTFSAKARLFTDVEADLSITVEIDPKQLEENKKAEAILAKEKEAAKVTAAEAAESGSDEIAESDMTDEQRLDKQARDLLRS